MYSNKLRNKVISELFFFRKSAQGMAVEKISLKLSIILNLKRQTSGRHFGPVIQSFDGMFNRALIIKY